MPPRPRAPKSPEETLSRALSRTLRHVAQQQGIPQDEHGWCKISDILAKPPYTNMENATPEGIYQAVATDKKGRYELNVDRSAIRAVQGHTVAVDVGLTPLTAEAQLPAVLVHGTYKKVWPIIQKQGLSKMSRLHIHMASGLPGNSGVISGMRAKSEVYIYLDGPKLLRDNVPLFKAANGALLSPGIEGFIRPQYFLKVTDSQGNEL